MLEETGRLEPGVSKKQVPSYLGKKGKKSAVIPGEKKAKIIGEGKKPELVLVSYQASTGSDDPDLAACLNIQRTCN